MYTLRVRILDARGRLVRTLAQASAMMGECRLRFDGRADDGRTLGPGLYAVIVELAGGTPPASYRRTLGLAIAGKRR